MVLLQCKFNDLCSFICFNKNVLCGVNDNDLKEIKIYSSVKGEGGGVNINLHRDSKHTEIARPEV